MSAQLKAQGRVAQAIAGALRGDEDSRCIGFRDALTGAPWACPAGADMLAYSLGYADGEVERAYRFRDAERRQ